MNKQYYFNLRFKHLLFILVFILGGSALAIAIVYSSMSDEDPPYFPDSVFAHHEVWRRQFSAQLKAFKEPSLFQISKKEESFHSYRFLWLSTGRHPCCVRIANSGGKISLVASQHDGSPGMLANPSKQIITTQIKKISPKLTLLNAQTCLKI